MKQSGDQLLHGPQEGFFTGANSQSKVVREMANVIANGSITTAAETKELVPSVSGGWSV